MADGDPRVVHGFRGDTVHERLEYHETGQLLSRGQLLKGLRHGVWNSYYESGMPWSQVSYDRGEEHGSYRTYHDNGGARHGGRLSITAPESARGRFTGRTAACSSKRRAEVQYRFFLPFFFHAETGCAARSSRVPRLLTGA